MLAETVNAGAVVLFAITVPIADLDSTGALTGGIDGSIEGSSNLHYAPLGSTGTLTGELAGSIEGAANLHYAPLGSTGALTGELDGSIGGSANLHYAPLDSTGVLTGGLAGSVSGAASVVTPVVALTPNDFAAPSGRETLILLAISVVGDARVWWSSQDEPNIGMLNAASDVAVNDDQDITRVQWVTNLGRLILNDQSPANFSTTFADIDARFHLLRAVANADPSIATFDANASNVVEVLSTGFARWNLPVEHAFRTLADTIQPGDSILFAVTIPETISAVDATGVIEAGLEGSIEGSAGLYWPPLNATGALEGGIAGSVSGAASLTPLDSTGALTGGIDGSISGAASLGTAITHDATGALIGGLTGSIVGSAYRFPLLPSAFVTPDDRRTIVVMAITVGEDSEWYHDSPAVGVLGAGSDALLTGTQSITRVRFEGNDLILNDDPAAATLTSAFTTGGVAFRSRFHLLHHDGRSAVFDTDSVTQTTGGNFIRWSGLPAAFVNLASDVSSGDSVVVAFTMLLDLAAIGALDAGIDGSIEGAANLGHAPLVATGSLTGALTGSVAGSAALGAAVFHDATGALDAGIDGSIEGAANLGHAPLVATGSLTAALAGSIAGSGSLGAPVTHDATGALDAGIDGSIEGAADLFFAPRDAAGALTGSLAGSIEGTATLSALSALDATGVLDAGIDGSISGAANLGIRP